jgi:hypothetical protein
MWVKNMAKKAEQPKAKKIEAHKQETHSYFPKFLILFSLIVIAFALNHFFKLYTLPDYVVSIVLFLSGLWMFKIGLEKGMYRRRKEVVKKYL